MVSLEEEEEGDDGIDKSDDGSRQSIKVYLSCPFLMALEINLVRIARISCQTLRIETKICSKFLKFSYY
jgi:hypothetical protein